MCITANEQVVTMQKKPAANLLIVETDAWIRAVQTNRSKQSYRHNPLLYGKPVTITGAFKKKTIKNETNE